jgi:hypothetical protein
MGETGVINGRSKKKERKFCGYSCSFYEERREARAKNRKGALETRKKQSSYYITITHSLALALGIGKEFCREQKANLRMSEIYFIFPS